MSQHLQNCPALHSMSAFIPPLPPPQSPQRERAGGPEWEPLGLPACLPTMHCCGPPLQLQPTCGVCVESRASLTCLNQPRWLIGLNNLSISSVPCFHFKIHVEGADSGQMNASHSYVMFFPHDSLKTPKLLVPVLYMSHQLQSEIQRLN